MLGENLPPPKLRGYGQNKQGRLKVCNRVYPHPTGQLALGDLDSRGKSKTEMGDNLPVANLGSEASVEGLSIL